MVLKRIAQIGYFSKGVAYTTLGLWALMAAFQMGGKLTNTKGAIGEAAKNPYSNIFLPVILGGIICYVIWRFSQGIFDAENHGGNFKALIKRAQYIIIGGIYSGLAFWCFKLLTNQSSSGGGSKESYVQQIFSLPMGKYIMVIIGIGIFCFAMSQFHKSFSGSFMKKIKIRPAADKYQSLISWFGRIGLGARGVVFSLVSWFIIRGAIQYDSEKASRGTNDAISMLAQPPFGQWWLAAVAAGLAIYGMYQILLVWFRKFDL